MPESATATLSNREQMLADVRAGFATEQKSLPPTWFYDEAGSRLFEEITRLPEYYLTRAERLLLDAHGAFIIGRTRPATLAELGAGSAEKTRILIRGALELRTELTFVPIDVSGQTLGEATVQLAQDFQGLTVLPIVADMREDSGLPPALPRPLLYAFLGSTIGNFEDVEAVRLLASIRRELRTDDRVLLGIDLTKDPAVIEAAYNDSAGVTAEFNLNVLRVLNRELGADFEIAEFEHRAFYDRALRRIEMHLVSKRSQTVTVPEAGEFTFAEGETIRTEISSKYDRADIDRLFDGAGLAVEEWISAPEGTFALVLGRARLRFGEPPPDES